MLTREHIRAEVAELADAQDLGFAVSILLVSHN